MSTLERSGSVDARRRRAGAARQPSREPGLFGIRSLDEDAARRRAACSRRVSIFPLLYMVSLSFQPTGDILSSAPVAGPVASDDAQLRAGLDREQLRPLLLQQPARRARDGRADRRLASLAAFAFARYRFRFKEMIFYVFLASLAVPSVELIIPQYLLMERLHLHDSLTGLVLIYSSENLPFSIFLLRGFFEAVPRSSRSRSGSTAPARCACSPA